MNKKTQIILSSILLIVIGIGLLVFGLKTSEDILPIIISFIVGLVVCLAFAFYSKRKR